MYNPICPAPLGVPSGGFKNQTFMASEKKAERNLESGGPILAPIFFRMASNGFVQKNVFMMYQIWLATFVYGQHFAIIGNPHISQSPPAILN